ncbi:MAG: HAMP domain-containing protein, partial [Eubacteriales bacterium]|nr:HAMP domain-containing protein [Eubacteriales bacterium]
MNWYKNINLKAKFLFTFGIVVILVAILGFVGINSNSYATKSYNEAMNNNKDVVTESIDIIQSVIDIRVTALQNASAVNPETATAIINEIETVYAAAKTNLEEFLAILNSFNKDGNRQVNIDLATSILNDLEEYYTLLLDFVDETVAGNQAEALRINAELTKIGDRFFTNIYLTPTNAFETLGSDIQKVDQEVKIRGVVLFILFVIILAFIVIFGSILSRGITRPIDKLKAVALKVVKGNLNVEARTNVRDEIGELSNAVADMAETLQYILDDINELSDNLEEGNISYRINPNNYEGAFKTTTESINT